MGVRAKENAICTCGNVSAICLAIIMGKKYMAYLHANKLLQYCDYTMLLVYTHILHVTSNINA